MKQLLISISSLGLLLMASSTPRPTEVLSVSPPQESTQTHVRYIGASLELGKKSEVSSLQLFVDGVDVTKLSRIGSTRDGCLPVNPGCLPPSHAEIHYAPNNLEPGIHSAEVRLLIKDGKAKSYAWSFSIKSH